MEGRLLDKIAKPFNVEMPDRETLESTLDDILPQIRHHSEDLFEEVFLDTHFVEMRDDVTFHDVILHIFREGGDHLTSKDGQMDCGQWSFVGNKMVIGSSTCSGTLYTLAFSDPDFFILERHGNTRKFAGKRYLVLVKEPLARRMEWNEALEYLFDKYRNSNSFFVTVAVIVVAVIVLVLLLI